MYIKKDVLFFFIFFLSDLSVSDLLSDLLEVLEELGELNRSAVVNLFFCKLKVVPRAIPSFVLPADCLDLGRRIA